MIDVSALNWIGILVAAVAAFFIGFLWHGPLFGKTWLKLMKITEADMEREKKEMAGKMHWYMLAAFLQQLAVATVTAILVSALGVTDVASASLYAFLVWFAYIAATLLNGVLWEKRTIPLYLFNITYQLVILVVITLIVGLWR